MKAYDLYCGLGGWAEGFLAEGYDVTGFDIEAHDYGTGGYSGKLILRDVRSIHGSELKDAACIVGSSPCQEFSYRAMPWKRAKALPPPYLGIELFNAQFRIQREASEAAARYIPLIVENVRGAQKWVGRAQWNYGSFYLWGDVPALMPTRRYSEKSKYGKICLSPEEWKRAQSGEDIAHPHSGKSFQTASVEGVKVASESGRRTDGMPMMSSKSSARKAASAMIAKIPFPLASHIARCFKQWISVKDRLPEYGEWCIVVGKFRIVQHVAYARDIGEWRPASEDADSVPDSYVTHWMPLPEPPNEDAALHEAKQVSAVTED